MKGSRKLTFEEKVTTADPSGEVIPTPPRSPRKSSKVCIREIDEIPSTSKPPVVVVIDPPPFVKPPDIQFSQHYDVSTPPPNCTSGAYDFEEEEPLDPNDPRNDAQLMEVATRFINK